MLCRCRSILLDGRNLHFTEWIMLLFCGYFLHFITDIAASNSIEFYNIAYEFFRDSFWLNWTCKTVTNFCHSVSKFHVRVIFWNFSYSDDVIRNWCEAWLNTIKNWVLCEVEEIKRCLALTWFCDDDICRNWQKKIDISFNTSWPFPDCRV